MKTKKKIVLLSLGCLFLFVLAFFAVWHNKQKKESVSLPREAEKCVEMYISAYKEGTEEAVVYMHFEDEFRRNAYINSNDKLLEYVIKDTEKLSDDLYALTVEAKTENNLLMYGDTFRQAFNFVVRIDGEWYYLNGASHIPENLRGEIDLDKYIKKGDNVVDPGDIIGEIGGL